MTTPQMDVRTVGYPHTRVSATKTRLANTTAYGANDVVSEHATTGTLWKFTNIARKPGGSGYIVYGRITTDEVTVQGVRYRLYLFNSSAMTGVKNDAATNTEPVYADESLRVGVIDFDAMDISQTSANSSESQRDDLRLAYTCATDSRDLWGLLVVLDALTPASGQLYTITLETEPSD